MFLNQALQEDIMKACYFQQKHITHWLPHKRVCQRLWVKEVESNSLLFEGFGGFRHSEGPDGVSVENLRFKNEKNGIVWGFGDFSTES